MSMSGTGFITATEAIYWIAYREHKTWSALQKELANLYDGFSAWDHGLRRTFVRYRCQDRIWTLEAYDDVSKDMLKNFPEQMEIYKNKLDLDWPEIRRKLVTTAWKVNRCEPILNDVERDLFAAIADEIVSVFGIKSGSNEGEHEIIPVAYFASGNITFNLRLNDLTYHPDSQRAKPSWQSVQFKKSEIHKEWPPGQPLHRHKVNGSATLAEVVSLLVDVAKRNNNILPARDTHLLAAREYFKKQNKKMADKIYNAARKEILDNTSYGIVAASAGRKRNTNK